MMKIKFFAAVAAAVLISVTMIFGVKGTAYAADLDSSFAVTYKDEKTKMQNAPSVVADAQTAEILNSVKPSGERPSNVILRFGENAEVLDVNGLPIGNFAEIYEELKSAIIPVVLVDTDGQADAVIKFFNEKTGDPDVTFASDKPQIVKKLRETFPSARGAVFFNELADDYSAVKIANESYANIVILPQSEVTAERVAYIQARFKTVWAVAADTQRFTYYDCFASGAHAVVTGDFSAAYKAIRSLSKNIITRTSFNVAHRGLPKIKNENSASGIKAAVAAGATHVEIDGYITTDNVIYASHDGSLGKITTGSGYIEQKTSAEMETYRLTQYYDEKIPSLDEVIDALEGSRTILILEIKSNYCDRFVAALKKVIDRRDFYRRFTVISFTESVIEKMKTEMPQVPTSLLLHDTTDKNTESMIIKACKANTTLDAAAAWANPLFARKLKERGFATWFWTYDSAAAAKAEQAKGYLGLTNNNADGFKISVRFAEGEKGQKAESLNAGDAVKITVTTYGGKTAERSGEVVKVEDCGDYFKVLAAVKVDSSKLILPVFTVEKIKEEVSDNRTSEDSGIQSDRESDATSDSETSEYKPEQKSGCKGSVELLPLSLCLFAALVAIKCVKEN